MKFQFARLELNNGGGEVGEHGAGFGVGHQAPGQTFRPSLATIGIMSGTPATRKRTRSALYALAAETHCQASIPLTKWSLRHQAMADDNFGGMTPKGNVAWVPTALSALATMELA